MRRIALILISFFYAASANADIITFEYTGTINTLRETNLDTGVSRAVVSSSIVPGRIRVGDDFHGTFTLNTHLALDSSTPHSAWYTDMSPNQPYVAPTSITFDKTGRSFSSAAVAPTIVVHHTPGLYDFLRILPTWGNNRNLSFDFSEPSAAVLPNLSIPSDIHVGDWTKANAALYWLDDAHANYLMMDGMLTSITKVSSVPEPESYAMLLMGLGLVAGVAARRKQPRG